jgi:ArsR family transcriptional regulator, arsenate/arsenite/antimonite-responsive transcriptional repressor
LQSWPTCSPQWVPNRAYGSCSCYCRPHPDGLVVTEIQDELEIPNSILSHHLEKLKGEDLVRVQRESTFLRYTANTDALQELLQFLYAECCTRNKAVKPEQIVRLCK